MNAFLHHLRAICAHFGVDSLAPISLSHCTLTYPALLERSMAEPKLAVMMLIPYHVWEDEGKERNLSRYAVPRDYHGFASILGRALTEGLQVHYPDAAFAFFADHSPIDERDAAAKCGLGVLGDNHLFISPNYGSYVFLAELITDLNLSPIPAPIEPGVCLHCGACKRACPSPDFCLSAITQKKGELTEEEIALMKEHHTVWGCDICQECCPMNRGAKSTKIPYFREDRILNLTSEHLDAMSKEEFQSRAFAWRGRRTIGRNLELFRLGEPEK